MAFSDLSAELSGVLPGLSPILADKYIQRAWLDICKVKRWSFLQADGVIVCPTMITTGTFNITQYSNLVTANAAATAALIALGSTPGLTNLQIRFGSTATMPVGQVYRIMAVDTTNPVAYVLTLDRVVVEATNTTSSYQCYRCFVTPPDPAFLAWDSIVDTTNGWTLRLNRTSAQFDISDPQRTSQGDAYYCGFFRAAPWDDPNVEAGSMIYELWPAQTNGRTFYARYTLQGQPFTNPGDTQPSVISDDLIVQRALWKHAYPFALANIGNFPTFKNANWPFLIATAKGSYDEAMKWCRKNEDAQALTTIYSRGHGLRGGSGLGISYPIDANFIQSHLI